MTLEPKSQGSHRVDDARLRVRAGREPARERRPVGPRPLRGRARRLRRRHEARGHRHLVGLLLALCRVLRALRLVEGAGARLVGVLEHGPYHLRECSGSELLQGYLAHKRTPTPLGQP